MATQTYNLKLGEAILMREALSTPGWATTVTEIYGSGKLLSEVFDSLPNPKSKSDLETVVTTVTLTDSNISALKKALSFAAEKGYLVPSVHTNNVLEIAGLTS